MRISDWSSDVCSSDLFCPLRGRRAIGVFSVAAHLSRTLPDIDVRFYCGGESPWEDYAIYHKRRRRNQLTKADVEGSVPVWARTTTGTKPWADVKAAVHRDFVSGTRQGFRVLVETKALGMGIEKPSIRKVIHMVAPTSPEAF